MPNIRSLPDRLSLDALREAVEDSAARLAEHRADMIESLGDHLCGCGPGPQPADADMLTSLEQTHRALRLAYDDALQRAAAETAAGR
jgi:hypothetical protein